MDRINLVILVCAGLVVVSVFTSMLAFRAGAPLLLLFLAIGLLAGPDGLGGLVLADASNAFLIGNAALAIILFDSGFHTSLKSYRQTAGAAVWLATAGVLLTAGLIALPAHLLLGLDWPMALLVATTLSSTDAAALFILLRVGGITIRVRVRSTLEIESGTNDPVAASLSLALVGLLGQHHAGGGLQMVADLARQLAGGTILGILGGTAIVVVVNRIRLEQGLYPVMVMGLAVAVYALTNLSGGSGFLAAYLAGLVAGNARLQASGSIRRFQDGITWLAQIGMFVTLGLLARPSHFSELATVSAGLAALLILVARPVAVFLCLAPFHFTARERVFIAWVGLRGAVSILLAMMPSLAGVPGGDTVFEITFLVVVVSLALQGWTVRPLARWLSLIVPQTTGVLERVEIDIPGLPDSELVTYRIHPESPVAQGGTVPRWARPLLAQRGARIERAPRHLESGDRVFLLASHRQLSLLDKLFGRARDGEPSEASLLGEFAITPDATVAALRDTYDLPLAAVDDAATVASLFRKEFRSDIEVGDRLRLGPVDLIVREMSEGRIQSVGIALDPAARPPDGWDRIKQVVATVLSPANHPGE